MRVAIPEHKSQPHPTVETARFVEIEEFLAPLDLHRIVDCALRRKAEFSPSHVIAPGAPTGRIDSVHRRSRGLFEIADLRHMMLRSISPILHRLFADLSMASFEVSRIEAQLAATNDGEFFKIHTDNSHPRLSSRRLTFVFFFNRDPAPFSGGALRIYDTSSLEGRRVAASTWRDVQPRQNTMVFFPSETWHEILPVRCPSGSFADSRFTLNGWLHADR
jgi:Rps23 Pro-64 3,4-dihydroxylase Tpa1-like proline 4-hydroxylase